MSAGRSALKAFCLLLAAMVASTSAFAAPPSDGERQPEPPASPPPLAQVSRIDTTPPACAGDPSLLGLSRIVEIDTASGPRFGDQYSQRGETHFLEDHEVVLTFDDGPIRRYTMPILEALDAQCTRATFFSVGRMAIADPQTLQEVARRGHTIATHTWSHKKLTAVDAATMKYEVEVGLSAVVKTAGVPVAPFFRFPYLADPKAGLAYLQGRGLGAFGIHVDSADFRTKNPAVVLRNVMQQLEHEKKGIILFHDIQPSTAGALGKLLAELKAKGFKVVHMVPKTAATTLPEYDAIVDKALKKKAIAAAADPLAPRAVTWPVASGAGAEPAATDETLPWAEKKPARTPRTARPQQPPAITTDPWAIRTMGDP